MKKLLLLFILLSGSVITAQEVLRSTLQEQADHYSNYTYTSDSDWDALRMEESGTNTNAFRNNVTPQIQTCTLNKRVFGWHPYWVGSVYQNYRWNLLSDLCYFSYDIDPATGSNTNGSFAWNSSAAVTAAINNGTNVHFCVTLFSSHTSFLGNGTAQQTLITNIINLLNSRGGKGVNIDFEGMGASHKTAFTAFMQNLSNQLHAANPNYELSVCLYAVDWSAVFDIAALDSYIDLYTIMGYDYYYSGSSTAGPEAPLYNFQTGYNYTLAKSITYYLKQGATPSKVLLGLPWYGREWETGSSIAPSATTGGFTSSRTYSYVQDNPTTYSAANRHWESNSFSPYYSYQSAGNWRQCWIDDAYSMRKKFDLVNQRGIGGIGIWALGYDDGYSDYWDAIEAKFSTCAVVPCSDTIYDMGGPGRNYYDSEQYMYTIQPAGASNVSLAFSQFDVELNYDTLWLYNGLTTASPLIGAYTGTNSPGTVTSTNGGITLRFKSDNGTVNPGFTAIYHCINDNIAPTTQVMAPTGWITQDFTSNFTDEDDMSGTGVEKSFYQVLEFNGSEWRANKSRGFFSDYFDQVIHPDWNSFSGTWAINSMSLEQSDAGNGNSNIWAACDQNLSNRYLYSWRGKINGTGNNRRAGFHFFCDSASTVNRYNSYFAWFRVDQSVIEIYKVNNDVFSLVSSTPYTFALNTFYDFTISFDRISGQVQIWVDNVLSANWQDPSPHTIGKYISFRSGNCIYTVDNLNVYRSRLPSVTVTVGPGPGNDIRYENTTPITASGWVASIVKDSANNLSIPSAQYVNVDWTKPIPPASVIDGNMIDLDTTTFSSALDGTYTMATDTNSGVMNYFYAIGTTPGAQDVTPWTNNNTSLYAVQPVSMIIGQHYYFAVKAMNGAGLMSDSTVSDGVLILSPVGLKDPANETDITLYPNPAKESAQLSILSEKNSSLSYILKDANGKTLLAVKTVEISKGLNTLKIDLASLGLAQGMYFISFTKDDKTITKKLIVGNE
ncbi:MAG: N-acetylmuramyl-L-alanine amidase, negative regulator of AmpC, AmpD [Bacteroidetes bacterium]|jgi:spore germination protein YaaH|nr:N-acetylmuramyl-L-alanine amidase, negative regulator of AmpC, AmpD [Bacteroidota bacterium]